MKFSWLSPAVVGLVFTSLETMALDTWVLTDGRMFEADVMMVSPGSVTFKLRTGTEQSLELTKLSERSRKQLVESLGLGSTPVIPVVPPTVTGPATPATVPSSPTTVAQIQSPRDPQALKVSDTGALEANFGLAVTVVGKVKKVVTLGRTGHKLLEFEGTDFNVFINKREVEQPGWDFEGMEGKQVQVTGKIGKYNEKLQIQLFQPEQIGLIE